MNKRIIYDDKLYIHFVTFSCYKRRNLLTPDLAKQIVIGSMAARLKKAKAICSGFVIMPNHVHALLWFPESGQLSEFMNRWKEQSSKQIKQLFEREYPNYLLKTDEDEPVWQARYYPFHIESGAKLQEKLDYMHLNPVTAGLVKKARDWRWSSARWFLEGKSVGVPIGFPPGIGL